MGWFHTRRSSPAVTPDYTGLQLQTSVNALPVPIIWGQTKLAPNVIWYANFQTHTQTQSSGGKGLLRTTSTSGDTYSADVMLALCEGSIAGIVQIWKDRSISTLSSLGLSFFPGQTPQSVWGYLAAHYPAQALAYQGTAYVCAANYPLGSNAEIANHNFEVQGVLHASGINAVDADPAAVIWDFLTNAQYGLGFNPASVSTASLFGASGDASLQTYCRAMGIAFSPALKDQEQSSSILQRWLQICNCAAVWSGGQLKFIPYGDQPFIGYGYAFSPNLTPIYSLTDDDFVDAKNGEDPVLVSRTDPFSLPNIQRIEVCDRNNQYASTPIEARDQAQIEIYGMRLGSTVTAHEICDVSVVAPTVAQTILQRALYVRTHFSFKLSCEYCLLDPLDIVEITDANLGLSAFPVRIVSIEEDEKGILTVNAEELTVGVSTPVLYPTHGAVSNIPDFNAAPGNVNAPYFYEPTDQLGGGLNLVIGLSPQDPAAWGGCVVYVSADGVDNYAAIGSIKGATRMGALTAPLPSIATASSGATIDTANVLSVNLAESAASLSNGSAADMSAFNTACVVGNEIIAYQSATLTGANAYNLAPLARGGYGSAIASHAAGAPFMRLDGSSFVWSFTADRIGQTLYFKFASFNMVGGAEQSLADVGAYAYTITGAALSSPLPNVTNLYSNYEGGFQKIYWDEVKDFRSAISYEIRQGSTWATALPIRTQAHPPFVAQGNGQFWVSAKCTPVAGLTVYSAAAQSITVSGNQLSLNLVKSWDEQATGWTGAFDAGLGTDGVGVNKFLRIGGAQNVLAVSPFLESLTTSAATPSGAVLQFSAGVPAGVTKGLAVANKTHPSTIPASALVQSTTPTTVTLNINVAGGGVASGDTIVFSDADILNAGGIITNTPLYYASPLSHVIDIGYVAQASLNASSLIVGVPVGQNILSINDVLHTPDILGAASTAFVDGWVEFRIATSLTTDIFAVPDAFASPDAFAGGFAWGPWQKFVPGVQLGRAFQFRIALESGDPATIAYALVFNYQVQVPGRIDHYLNQTVPAAGLNILFAPDGAMTPAAFNAGVNASNPTKLAIQVDWQAQPGDTYLISVQTLSGMTLTFFNGGAAVQRTGVTIIVEGY